MNLYKVLLMLIATTCCWDKLNHRVTMQIAQHILKENDKAESFGYFDKLFSQEVNFCKFGLFYNNLTDSAPLADQLKKITVFNEDEPTCKELKDGAATENHFINQNGGNILKAIPEVEKKTLELFEAWITKEKKKKGEKSEEEKKLEEDKNEFRARNAAFKQEMKQINKKLAPLNKEEEAKLTEIIDKHKLYPIGEKLRTKETLNKEEETILDQTIKSYDDDNKKNIEILKKLKENKPLSQEEEAVFKEFEQKKDENTKRVLNIIKKVKEKKSLNSKEEAFFKEFEENTEEMKNIIEKLRKIEPLTSEEETTFNKYNHNDSEIKKIDEKIKELQKKEKEEKAKAKYFATVSLATLVHLIGDLYQPNHNYSGTISKVSIKSPVDESLINFNKSPVKKGEDDSPNSKSSQSHLKEIPALSKQNSKSFLKADDSITKTNIISDRGGTLKQVRTKRLVRIEGGGVPSLHYLFDTVFEPDNKTNHKEIAKNIVEGNTAMKKSYDIQASHKRAAELAEKEIYPSFEQNRWVLNEHLLKEMKKIAHDQLREAGGHIAWCLDNLYQKLKEAI